MKKQFRLTGATLRDGRRKMRMIEEDGSPVPNERLYPHTSALFDIRYAQKDYARDAGRYVALMHRLHPGAANLLDVACGTGQHLRTFVGCYRAEGLDLNHELLAIARERLGNIPLHQGDMAAFELGRTFDLITCLFASTPYLVTVERLSAAIATMARHLAPDGVLFIEPWLTPAIYRENEVVHNLRRNPELTASWMYVQRRVGAVAVWDIHWLIGTPADGVRHVVEHEELALYTIDDYRTAYAAAGLAHHHHPRGLHGYGAHIGRRSSFTVQETALIDERLAG